MRSYTRAQLMRLAQADAKKYGVDPGIFLRQINQESGFNVNAKSGAGALGVAQFMPGTAAGYHINPMDPVAALDAAARMDSGNLKKYGSYERMLSAYNSGRPDKYMDPHFAGGQTYNYVRSIMGGKSPKIPAGGGTAGAGGTPTLPGNDLGTPALGGGGMDPRQALFMTLLQRNMDFASGKKPDSSSSLQQLLQLRMAQQGSQGASNAQVGPTKGSLSPAYTQALTAPGKGAMGRIKWQGDLTGVKPQFLSQVSSAASAMGATAIKVTSGYRSPSHNAAVGGVTHSNHMTGDALDGYAYVPQRGWVPLGTFLKGDAGKYGLRSGDQAGFYRGGPDYVHVDDGANQR